MANKKSQKFKAPLKASRPAQPKKPVQSPEVPGKPSKRNFLFTKKNIVTGVVALLFIIMYIQIQSLLGTFSFLQGRDSSLITEIGQIKDSYQKIGGDLNEVREFLRLPRSNYNGLDELEEEDDDKNEDSVQLALFKYVDFLGTQKKYEERLAHNQSLLENLASSENFETFLNDNDLSSKVADDNNGFTLSVYGPSDEILSSFRVEKSDGKLFRDQKEIKYDNADEFIEETIDFLEKNKDALIEKIAAFETRKSEIKDAIVAAAGAIAELEISIDENFAIYNKVGTQIGEIVIDTDNSKIKLIDKNDDSLKVQVTDIGTALIPFLEKLDTRSFAEKKAAQVSQELRGTLRDGGFKLLLSEYGLTISEEPRETADRIYYDIYDEDGEHLSSLVLEKMTGVVHIVQPDGTNSENLLFFNPEFKKKTLALPDEIPDFEDTAISRDGTFNVLIAGKHGALVDTMIFAHVNQEKGTVRMISIPRDLVFNGRKINSYAYYYGMPELKKVLSKMTGYELDKYILIDMYAFIDVVDLIGGIDIHLDQAVVDPYYKTKDNGVEGTLHYEPGDYHLSGVQALRLARSRKTSSDFARAERQQKILQAVQHKARNFGFGDADTIYEISKTVLAKTETDVSLEEAITYYFRYQNYEIESTDVMSSGNVLYVPPYITVENCQKLIDAAAAAGEIKPDCEGQNHAYTLQPRNDNWNIIKWFFREKFDGV